MEMEGHPTQDLVDELVRRGAVVVPGDSSGPGASALEAAGKDGFWVYVAAVAYDTEIDDGPPSIV